MLKYESSIKAPYLPSHAEFIAGGLQMHMHQFWTLRRYRELESILVSNNDA